MTEYAKKLLRLYHEQGKKDRMIEGSPPLSFTSGSPGNLNNYRIFGNSVEQVISNNLFYKVISGAGMQTDGTIKSDSSYNMLFAKIIPGQDYIAAKGEVNSTALTYTLYNVYDHDPDIGSQALLPSWKSTNNNGIINYTGDTPVYLGLRVPASTAFPHLNIGTTIYDYDEYEASITGVGDKVTDSQYLIPVTITNGADTQTTNLYLPEPLKMVGDEAEYIDYREQKMHKVRKNLFPVVATSKTVTGVTFTVNADKSVTCNGTNNGTSTLIFEFNSSGVSLEIRESYIVTGCPEGGKMSGGYTIQYYNGSSWSYEIGHGATFTVSGSGVVRPRILISREVTVDNLTFYPMIRKANIEDDTYEPYIEDTDLDVTLPALPTIAGANVLTVGTEAQPSKVEIKGKIKAV